MSELINNHDGRVAIRWKLLTSASALTLVACMASINVAKAEDADRPLIWIELGGQMESVSGQGAGFLPDFLSVYPTSSVLWKGVTPLQAQKPSAFGFGEDGKISFQPEGSNWVFSAAIRYGRSSSSRHVDHQTNRITQYSNLIGTNKTLSTVEEFSDTHAHRAESHAILDFDVGKDVGLGMFGKDGSSSLSFGVRFAQFASSATFDIRARPDFTAQLKYISGFSNPAHQHYFHTYHAAGQSERDFHGVGPSLSWNGSVPVVGNVQDGEVIFDWGANVALLFGKQRAHVRHQETGRYYNGALLHKYYTTLYQHPPAGHDTDRSVTVPNVGGSAGISFRKGDAKISFGYRADFFVGAVDTGIDSAKKSNLTFNGPYASISIGLGD